MQKFIESFRDSDDGAVTVDWVVLSAAAVTFAIATVASMSDATSGLAGSVSSTMGATTVSN